MFRIQLDFLNYFFYFRQKFNISFPILKLNLTERKIGLALKFFNWMNENLTKLFFDVKQFVKSWPKDKINCFYDRNFLLRVQEKVTLSNVYIKSKKTRSNRSSFLYPTDRRKSESVQKENMNEAWARTVDLPGLEDNISPNNRISTLLRFVINEFQLSYSRSSDSADRVYLIFRLGQCVMDAASMNYGPAYQLSFNSILITDKLHTTSSGQYLDLVYSPMPSSVDLLTVLYRRVTADCPDFWSHFHGVETCLVADAGVLNVTLHQESLHTILTYWRYIKDK